MDATTGNVSTPAGRPVYIFNDKTSVASKGEVLVKFNWKSSEKSGKVAHTARCVSIPALTILLDKEDGEWVDFVNEAAQEYQRSLMHKYLTEELDAGNLSPSIPADYLDKEWVLLTWQEEQANSGRGKGRISGEAIKEFFDANMVEPLSLVLAEKKGYTDETFDEAAQKVVEQAVNNYRALMMKLSTSDLQGNVLHLTQARKALDYSTDKNSGIYQKIARRIDTLEKVTAGKLEELL